MLTAKWEEGFASLKAYKKEHKDCSVPALFKTNEGFTLGQWVSTQRAVNITGKLISQRVQRLDELGFVWDTLTAKWEEGFASLKAYKEEHKDCLVHIDFKTGEGFTLGSWVRGQRKSNRKGTLAPERILRLDELGFVWDPLTAQWQEGFVALKAYKEEHKDCLVPKGFKTGEGFMLGGWVSHQRRGREKLTTDRLKRLDEVGFAWQAKKIT